MNNIIGVVESCSSTNVKGFICFSRGSALPELKIYINGMNVGLASYTEERTLQPGLQSYVCLNFIFNFTKSLLGKHYISAKVSENIELKNSPFLYCSDSLSNIFSNADEIKFALSQSFISGEGIEIGALCDPFPVKDSVGVKYVDRLNSDDLRREYPELLDKDIVQVDIVDDGEVLGTITDNSQDFIIASHFFEHAKNPIGFLFSCIRILRAGGVVLLVIPDKRYTFDVDRPLTTIAHIVNDYEIGHDSQQNVHFQEIAYFQKKLTGVAAEKLIQEMSKSNYSYHWHVWTSNSFLECIASIISKYSMQLEVLLFLKGKGEFYVVLMKSQ